VFRAGAIFHRGICMLRLPNLHIMLAVQPTVQLPREAMIGRHVRTHCTDDMNMRKTILRHLTGIFALLLATTATAASLDDAEALETYLDGVLVPLMKTENSPSGTVAIAWKGRIILAKGYGFEDIEAQKPVDPWQKVAAMVTWE